MQLDQAIAAAFEANERKLAAQVPLPAATLDPHQRALFSAFEHFCRSSGVRAIPAAPAVIACYLRACMAEGDAPAAAEAIRIAHQAHGLPCPVSTHVVRSQLNELIEDKPPRSWRLEEQLLWAALPPEIRGIISRRERERDLALRRKQNELAELTRQTATAPEAKPVADIEGKSNDHSQA
jgi:hypothetical protein